MPKKFEPDLGFAETQLPYTSASQQARILTESWVGRWLFCLSCGEERLTPATANSTALDFICGRCDEQYELKSKKGPFGPSVVDGAYKTLCERVSSDRNPNFAFMSYSATNRTVDQLFVVPKHFVVPDIIKARKPLAPTARRAGWVGCNIRLSQVPDAGKIYVVRNGQARPKTDIQLSWRKTLFLRDQRPDARSWLIDVLKACGQVNQREFTIQDVYAFEKRLSAIYPKNRNVRAKIRQQLQVLRDVGYLEFVGRGKYRLRD